MTGLAAEVLVEMLLGEVELEHHAILGGIDQSGASRAAGDRTGPGAPNFNQRKAARMLQVHRATLARKLKKHRLI